MKIRLFTLRSCSNFGTAALLAATAAAKTAANPAGPVFHCHYQYCFHTHCMLLPLISPPLLLAMLALPALNEVTEVGTAPPLPAQSKALQSNYGQGIKGLQQKIDLFHVQKFRVEFKFS